MRFYRYKQTMSASLVELTLRVQEILLYDKTTDVIEVTKETIVRGIDNIKAIPPTYSEHTRLLFYDANIRREIA